MSRKVSVVIPTYNRRDLIRETLETVRAQTHGVNEIVVVDDGSTDGTSAMLRHHYPDVRVISVPNGGDIRARNVGTRAVKTAYVAYCDSDDLWLPDHLERTIGVLDSDPDAVGAYANFHELRGNVLTTRSKFELVPDGYWECDRLTRLIDYQPYFPSCLVVRREALWRLGGWDEDAGAGADFATALRLARYVVPSFRPTVTIRKHQGSLSADNRRQVLRDAFILEHVVRTRAELAPHKRLFDASIRLRRRQALELAFDRRDYAAVRADAALLNYHRMPPKTAIKMLIGLSAGVVDSLPKLVSHLRRGKLA